MTIYSRRVVGWAMSDKLDADLAVAALKDAFCARKPAAGLIVHSDRGSQFASNKFRDALTEADALSSMSGGQLLRQCQRRALFPLGEG